MARITIDYTPAHEQGAGIGRLVREQVKAFVQLNQRHDINLFVAGARNHEVALPGLDVNLSTTRITPRWLARLWHRAHLPLNVEIFSGRAGLYHATDFVLPPTLSSTRTIVTVHDLSFVRVPEAASPRLRRYLEKVVPLSISSSDYVIADSQATKSDLAEFYGTSEEKISVVLSGVDKLYQPLFLLMAIRNKYEIPEAPYIFSIGTVQPRKNYSRLIIALSNLRSLGYDLHLVIAGGKGWLEDEMYKTLAGTKMSDYVHLIGFADDADLPALYSGAECVAFPSLYEGFGFPVLEGMACGTPVVTSNVSSLPEVAGDAALLVNPYDVDDLTNAIQRILDDSELREQLIERGLERAKLFTWHQSATQLLDVYNHVLEL